MARDCLLGREDGIFCLCPLAEGKLRIPTAGHCPESRLSLKTGTAGEEKKSRSLCPLIMGWQLTSLIQGRYDNDS